MGDKNYLNVDFNGRIVPIAKINSEFTKVKIYVQGIGKNRNYSYMSKERVTQMLPTLPYVPVVGHLIEKRDEDGNLVGRYMGGHDWDVEFEDGDFKIVDLTRPFGVVLAGEYDFEIVNEYGTDVEYLTAKAVLWTGRYPEVNDAIYDEKVMFNQSMEITEVVSRPYAEDSNYTELLSWQYSALCLLGKSDDPSEHTEPCFISSQVLRDSDEFKQMMAELKTQFAFLFEKNEEGGTLTMEKEPIVPETPASEEVMAIRAEIETLNASIAEMTAELTELREYRAEIEAASFEAYIDALREQFADIANVPEFIEFLENIPEEFGEEEILEKCYAIRGKNTTVSFSVKPDRARKQILGINPYTQGGDSAYKPYGGIDEKYLNK